MPYWKVIVFLSSSSSLSRGKGSWWGNIEEERKRRTNIEEKERKRRTNIEEEELKKKNLKKKKNSRRRWN